MGPRRKDITGKKFGRLTAVKFVSINARNNAVWECLCTCGTVKNLPMSVLKITKSCGCLLSEYRQRPKPGYAIKHGQASTRLKSSSSLYIIWGNMIRRCHNPKDLSYYRYGARGIQVCDRWRQSFSAFAQDMGPRPSKAYSIDRKNNDGNYEPENCSWQTAKRQARNRHNTVRLTMNGVTKPLMDWSELSGVKPRTIQHRLRLGWCVEDAVYKPTKLRGTQC